MRNPRDALFFRLIVLLSFVWAPSALAKDDLFEISELANSGRSVAAKLVDLNGDKQTDLFVVALTGIGLAEKREIRVYLANESGEIPKQPSHLLPLPRWSAVYDVADVRPESPGEELVILRPNGVSILSLAKPEETRWDLDVPGPSTVGVADDERGFEPFPLVYHDFGSEPWLLIPQIGSLTAVTPHGEVRAQLDLPRRANYLINPARGLISIESDPKHAAAARNAFEAAGVAKNVTLLEGNAAELLPTLEPPFDAVFVDADKEPMAKYFHEAMRLLAPGGLLLGDNGLLDGRVADPADGAADVEGVRAFNRLAASDPRLSATLVPIRDGLVVGVKTRA